MLCGVFYSFFLFLFFVEKKTTVKKTKNTGLFFIKEEKPHKKHQKHRSFFCKRRETTPKTPKTPRGVKTISQEDALYAKHRGVKRKKKRRPNKKD